MTFNPHNTINILLIEDEEFDVRRVRNTIKPFAATINIRSVISNGRNALDTLAEGKELYDVVIMDFQIAGGIMGELLIREIKKIDPTLQIIVITKMTVNIADFDFADSLMKAGAYWYCTKYPGDIEEYIYQPTDFILSIINAYHKSQLEKESSKTTKRLLQSVEATLELKRIVGESPGAEQLRRQIAKCAESDVSVLITGPSGTGKELVAHNIHFRSKRRMENFVPINCGSIPSELVESELFGYEKGSFTGAVAAKQGLFERANHGTIFLDEIGELPVSAQVKLLRVIQEGEIEKIGRTGRLKVDVRIIAASNKDLVKEVEGKRFREDLYYRLNVVPIQVPALRDRATDIPLLIEYFLTQFSKEMDKPVPEITPDAMEQLQTHQWKGNIRELKNVVQRILFVGDLIISKETIQFLLVGTTGGTPPPSSALLDFSSMKDILPLRQLEQLVRQKYFDFIRSHSASDADAAKKLGLAPSNYHRMCKELGIK